MRGVFQELGVLVEPVPNIELLDFVRFFTEFVGKATRLFIL
jgi:hypothetical protein